MYKFYARNYKNLQVEIQTGLEARCCHPRESHYPLRPWLESAWFGDSTLAPITRKTGFQAFAFSNGSTCGRYVSAKVHVERGHLQVLLSQVLNDLEAAVYPSLTDMVQDEDERERNMKETIEREKAASDAVRNLRATIKGEKDAHESYTSDKRRLMSVGLCKLNTIDP